MGRIFNWKGHEWLVGHPWGETHPNKDDTWFGDDSVNVDEDDVLELRVNLNPKVFDGIEKPFSVGLVTGTEKYSYGTYIWKCQLPYGTRLWPALWLTAHDSWPPEIDMLEAYSYENRTGYIKSCFKTEIETNVHYRDNEIGYSSIGAKGLSNIIYKLFHKNIDEYKCVWTEKYIKFYFNGIPVRIVKNRQVLDDLNMNHSMYPVMNLEIRHGYNSNDYMYHPVFRIYDFTYEPIDE